MNCPICDHKMSKPVEKLFPLPTVTSDCRPWNAGRSVIVCSGCGVMRRVVNYGADFDGVYDGYKSYPEPDGRTRNILEFAEEIMPIPSSVLDIGTGQGTALDILFSRFPEALIHGYDPYSDNPQVLRERPKTKYDLVTMFHTLEHVDDIHEIVKYIKSILSDGGHLLIQVPYSVMWPFDLMLADHYWHFNKSSIRYLLQNNGFRILHSDNDVIKKELTVLARRGIGSVPGAFIEEPPIKSLDWIVNYKKFLDTINEPVSVYGTGPAAAWSGNILGDKVYSYLDDDSERWGEFNGKPVQNPEECGIAVVAPFPDWQLPAIKANHPDLRFLC